MAKVKKKIVKEKNKGGRPVKYTPEIIANHGKGLIKFMQVETNWWLKDYCIENDFPSQLLSEWDKVNSEFSEAYKKAKDIQESRLAHMGMKKDNNVAFVIFTLRNVAKWKNEDATPDDESKQKYTITLPASIA